MKCSVGLDLVSPACGSTVEEEPVSGLVGCKGHIVI